MEQHIKLLLVTLAFHVGMLVLVPFALLLVQLPAEEPGRAAQDDPTTWASATRVGIPL